MKMYISCPISIDFDDLEEAAEEIEDYGDISSVNYWDRDEQYKSDFVTKCDFFGIILPNFKWEYAISSLPSGVKKELGIAIEKKKPILLVYKSSNGIKLYKTVIEKGLISGVKGTSKDVFTSPVIKKSIPELKSTYDRRLLLFTIN